MTQKQYIKDATGHKVRAYGLEQQIELDAAKADGAREAVERIRARLGESRLQHVDPWLLAVLDDEATRREFEEEADYQVTLVIRVSTHVGFAKMKRSLPISKSDAIDNAIGMLDFGPDSPNTLENYFAEKGFEIALPIDGEAVEA